MRPKDETDNKVQTGTFILSEKIDDTKSKRNEKEMKKEMRRLEKEKQEREKREKKAREKERERDKHAKRGERYHVIVMSSRVFIEVIVQIPTDVGGAIG